MVTFEGSKVTTGCRVVTNPALLFVRSTPLPSQSRIRSTALPEGEPKKSSVCDPLRLAFARSLSRIRSVTPRTGPRPPYAGPAPPVLSTGSTGGRRNRPLFPVSLWVFLILFLFFLLVFLSCYWFLFLYSCYLGCNLATSGVQFCTLTGAALHPHFTKVAPTFVQPCPLPVQTCTPSSCRFRARTRRMSSLSTAVPQPLR